MAPGIDNGHRTVRGGRGRPPDGSWRPSDDRAPFWVRLGVTLWVLLTLGILANQLCVKPASPAAAQDNPEDAIAETGTDPRVTARQDPALLLVQALVAEAGWTVHGDQAAILHVLRRRSTLPAFRRDDGLRPEVRVALRYVRAFNPRGRRSERQERMVNLAWPLLEQRAPGVVRVVRSWMAGTLADPCRAPAWHWGSRVDTHGSALPRVDCGRTTNVYLGAPVRVAGPPVLLPGATLPARVAAGRHR